MPSFTRTYKFKVTDKETGEEKKYTNTYNIIEELKICKASIYNIINGKKNMRMNKYIIEKINEKYKVTC